ncbi:MAG: hypothetical protein OXF02_05185 [Simkaniaceae bacterium]|nr:hypothetical protein [Simkaniaceae bacterium]
MTTKINTIITSEPVLKESDVDAPVSFPKRQSEIARKTGEVGDGVLAMLRTAPRGDKITVGVGVGALLVAPPLMITTSIPASVYGGALIGGLVAGISGTPSLVVGCGALAYECLTYPGCVKCMSKSRGIRDATTPSLPEPTSAGQSIGRLHPSPSLPAKGGVEGKTPPEPKGIVVEQPRSYPASSKAELPVSESASRVSLPAPKPVSPLPELEEMVVEQPKTTLPSPEPEWTQLSAWWQYLGEFFAEPSGATESVDESSV